jgi:hypothetical protein
MPTIQSDTAFRQRIKSIIADQANDPPILPDRLKEKGVEYTILVPLFENLLGYDPVDDIEYELSSRKVHGQRFDFLLDGKFVVESKALNTPLTGNIVKQVSDYIFFNDDINYGMVSNGLEFVFLIQRSFIEKVGNAGEPIVGATQNVYNVLTLAADDERFFDIIMLFSKTSYDEAFRAIAKYAFRQLVPTKGPTTPIVPDRAIDQYVKGLIEEKMDFKRGFYLNRIRAGELIAGQKLRYADKYVTITVTLQPDGTLGLPRGAVEVDANAILKDGEFKPLIGLITEWHDADQIFGACTILGVNSQAHRRSTSGYFEGSIAGAAEGVQEPRGSARGERDPEGADQGVGGERARRRADRSSRLRQARER